MNNLSLVDQNIFKFPSINKATSTDASAFFMLANSWFKLKESEIPLRIAEQQLIQTKEITVQKFYEREVELAKLNNEIEIKKMDIEIKKEEIQVRLQEIFNENIKLKQREFSIQELKSLYENSVRKNGIKSSETLKLLDLYTNCLLSTTI